MSRLECKVVVVAGCIEPNLIRICPDWNVKGGAMEKMKSSFDIRICPDWNVKELGEVKLT